MEWQYLNWRGACQLRERERRIRADLRAPALPCVGLQLLHSRDCGALEHRRRGKVQPRHGAEWTSRERPSASGQLGTEPKGLVSWTCFRSAISPEACT